MLIAMRCPQQDVPMTLREIKAQAVFIRMTSDSQQDAEASALATDVTTVQQRLVPEPVDLTQARQSIPLPAERFPVVARLEKQKYATVETPREPQAEPSHEQTTRCVPARVRRMVRQRDGGQCTSVAAGGHRGESRMRLEFDHIRPVCFGGKSTSANLRLRRRVHNQYEAVHLFGEEFMGRKRGRRAQESVRAFDAAWNQPPLMPHGRRSRVDPGDSMARLDLFLNTRTDSRRESTSNASGAAVRSGWGRSEIDTSRSRCLGSRSHDPDS